MIKIFRQVSILSDRKRTESELSDAHLSDTTGTSWKGSQGPLTPKMGPKRQKSTMLADTDLETIKLEKQVKEKKKEEKLIQAEGVETGKVKILYFPDL